MRLLKVNNKTILTINNNYVSSTNNIPVSSGVPSSWDSPTLSSGTLSLTQAFEAGKSGNALLIS